MQRLPWTVALLLATYGGHFYRAWIESSEVSIYSNLQMLQGR